MAERIARFAARKLIVVWRSAPRRDHTNKNVWMIAGTKSLSAAQRLGVATTGCRSNHRNGLGGVPYEAQGFFGCVYASQPRRKNRRAFLGCSRPKGPSLLAGRPGQVKGRLLWARCLATLGTTLEKKRS